MSLKNFQNKIGTTPDGAFGPGTFKAAMGYLKLSPERASHFFGQTGHETGDFLVFSENLNYSISGLKKIFSKYFPGDLAEQYANKPEKIANRVYANRMGNGNEQSGDGWKYRGRGAIQLTGKENYSLFSRHLGKPEIITNPDLVSTEFAFESALFFFDKNKLWSICDRGVNAASILALTKRINGGTNGLSDREAKTVKYYRYSKIY
jgi:putative chitinase